MRTPGWIRGGGGGERRVVPTPGQPPAEGAGSADAASVADQGPGPPAQQASCSSSNSGGWHKGKVASEISPPDESRSPPGGARPAGSQQTPRLSVSQRAQRMVGRVGFAIAPPGQRKQSLTEGARKLSLKAQQVVERTSLKRAQSRSRISARSRTRETGMVSERRPTPPIYHQLDLSWAYGEATDARAVATETALRRAAAALGIAYQAPPPVATKKAAALLGAVAPKSPPAAAESREPESPPPLPMPPAAQEQSGVAEDAEEPVSGAPEPASPTAAPTSTRSSASSSRADSKRDSHAPSPRREAPTTPSRAGRTRSMPVSSAADADAPAATPQAGRPLGAAPAGALSARRASGGKAPAAAPSSAAQGQRHPSAGQATQGSKGPPVENVRSVSLPTPEYVAARAAPQRAAPE